MPHLAYIVAVALVAHPVPQSFGRACEDTEREYHAFTTYAGEEIALASNGMALPGAGIRASVDLTPALGKGGGVLRHTHPDWTGFAMSSGIAAREGISLDDAVAQALFRARIPSGDDWKGYLRAACAFADMGEHVRQRAYSCADRQETEFGFQDETLLLQACGERGTPRGDAAMKELERRVEATYLHALGTYEQATPHQKRTFEGFKAFLAKQAPFFSLTRPAR